jgi:hypothetical protein
MNNSRTKNEAPSILKNTWGWCKQRLLQSMSLRRLKNVFVLPALLLILANCTGTGSNKVVEVQKIVQVPGPTTPADTTASPDDTTATTDDGSTDETASDDTDTSANEKNCKAKHFIWENNACNTNKCEKDYLSDKMLQGTESDDTESCKLYTGADQLEARRSIFRTLILSDNLPNRDHTLKEFLNTLTDDEAMELLTYQSIPLSLTLSEPSEMKHTLKQGKILAQIPYYFINSDSEDAFQIKTNPIMITAMMDKISIANILLEKAREISGDVAVTKILKKNRLEITPSDAEANTRTISSTPILTAMFFSNNGFVKFLLESDKISDDLKKTMLEKSSVNITNTPTNILLALLFESDIVDIIITVSPIDLAIASASVDLTYKNQLSDLIKNAKRYAANQEFLFNPIEIEISDKSTNLKLKFPMIAMPIALNKQTIQSQLLTSAKNKEMLLRSITIKTESGPMIVDVNLSLLTLAASTLNAIAIDTIKNNTSKKLQQAITDRNSDYIKIKTQAGTLSLPIDPLQALYMANPVLSLLPMSAPRTNDRLIFNNTIKELNAIYQKPENLFKARYLTVAGQQYAASPLITAAFLGNDENVELIIQQARNYNQLSKIRNFKAKKGEAKGESPLIVAARHGNLDQESKLCKFIKSLANEEPYEEATLCYQDVMPDDSKIKKVAAIATILLNKEPIADAMKKEMLSTRTSKGESALMLAAKYNNYTMVEDLLKVAATLGSTNHPNYAIAMVNQTDIKGNTALMLYLKTASPNKVFIATLLTGVPLDKGRKICKTDECKKTANAVYQIKNKNKKNVAAIVGGNPTGKTQLKNACKAISTKNTC